MIVHAHPDRVTRLVYALVTLSLLLGLGKATASENESEPQTHPESAHEGGGHLRHSLGLFLGATKEHDEYHDTLGIEYVYRINRLWSVGGVIERADRDKSSTLTNIFAHLHPWRGLYFGGGVGKKDPGEERENVGRVTIGWEFEIGKRWAISPQANLDFIEDAENEEVYGVIFGIRF